MSSAKTHDFKGRVYTELPADVVKKLGILAGDELEFIIEDDKVILTSSSELTNDETGVLRKINFIKHYSRTRDEIERVLSKDEMELVSKLFSKKALFEYTKEGKRLIGIDKEYFPMLAAKRTVLDDLFKKGYLVIDNNEEISELNRDLSEKGKQADVRGIRGFDKKYYVITADKFNEIEGKILKAIESEKLLKDLSAELNLDAELCKTAVEIMKEDGAVIEKKKDMYKGV